MRAADYQVVVDAAENGDGLAAVGRRIILPSTHPGSPRYMAAQYQDSLAIVRHLGKPHIFLTMTCNPGWPEIVENLLHGQNAWSRPDLTTRVFEMKKNELMDDLLKHHVLGKVISHIYVIEFQKRGLPRTYTVHINTH